MKITANINSVRSNFKKIFSLLNLQVIPIPKNIGSLNNSIYSNIQDKTFVQYANGTVVNDYQIELITIGDYSSSPIWTSSDTSVATVDSNGYASYVSDGICNISVSIEGQSLTKTLVFKTQTTVTPMVFFDHTTGSLAKHIWSEIDSRTSGKTKTNAINIFSTQDHNNNIYIRNVNSWAYGLDLSCFSPWNFDAGYMTAGALISPRHVLFCKHYNFYPQVPRPDGQPVTIRFINQNNQTITRTLTNIIRVNDSEYPNWSVDFAVGLLDRDVTTQDGLTTGISFAKILPVDWYKYLPSLSIFSENTYDRLPILYTDQEEKNLINHFRGIHSSSSQLQYVTMAAPTTPQHREFYEPVVRFDSGNPMFLIINNQLVVLSVTTGEGTGSFITGYISQINNIMNTLGGGYQLTPINLSAFTTF